MITAFYKSQFQKTLIFSLMLACGLVAACSASSPRIAPAVIQGSATDLPPNPPTLSPVPTEEKSIRVEPTAAEEPAPTPSAEVQPTSTLPDDPLAGLVYSADKSTWIIDRGGTPRRILDEPDARLSPDGNLAVYQPVYDPDVWLADLTTGERSNLTRSSGRFHGEAQWWPGRQDVLIFGSSEELGPGYGYPTIVRTDGSDYQILNQDAGGPLALSPDGQLLAYGSFKEAGKIDRLNGETEVFDPADYGLAVEKIFQPEWSPDGRQLAWMVSGDRETVGWSSGVAVFDLESKTADLFHTYLSHGGGMVPYYLSWSPSGDWLAFVTFNERPEDGRLPNLWISRLDGQDEMRLGIGLNPVWSPDGKRLAYNAYDESEAANQIRIYEPANGEEGQILAPGDKIVDWLHLPALIPAPLPDS